MSYTIGQFRRDMINNVSDYLIDLSYSIVPVTISTDVIDDTRFTNFAIQLTNQLQYGNSYYVKIGFKRLDTIQSIAISLQNTSQANDDVQYLNTIVIPAQDETNNKTVIVELAFSPNASYDQIMLTLQRTAYDYTITNQYNTSGRVLDINTDEGITVVAQFFNVVSILGTNNKPLRKIGVQGPPGLLMCINGEDIRIGPSGIYEIKSDYKINSIGFVVRESDQTLDRRDYFILDYQY